MTPIQPGDHVIVTAKVDIVITRPDGTQRVKLHVDELEWVDANRCAVIGKQP